MTKVLPVFGLCSKNPIVEGENQPLLDEENKGSSKKRRNTKKPQIKDTELKEDPFNFLGFGMVAYRDLMFTMMILFAVISVIMMPAMFMYRSHDGMLYPKGYA